MSYLKTLVAMGAIGISLPLIAGPGEGGHHHESEMATTHQQMMEQHHGGKNVGHHEGMSGHHAHGMGHGSSLAGKPGKEADVDRIIKVEANDSMRFMHDPLKIKNGETIKFVITNTGAVKHEFSIGTKDEHMVHGKMMMANPDMHHGPGGSSITIEPGKTETLIWSFEEAWEVQAACNIPGHYQAGMHSPVQFAE